MDFTSGIDRVDIQAFDLTSAEIQAALTDNDDGDAVLTLDDDTSITFEGVASGTLLEGDFLL